MEAALDRSLWHSMGRLMPSCGSLRSDDHDDDDTEIPQQNGLLNCTVRKIH